MRIQNLRIENFRGFRRFGMKNLRAINLLVGDEQQRQDDGPGSHQHSYGRWKSFDDLVDAGRAVKMFGSAGCRRFEFEGRSKLWKPRAIPRT